MQAAQNGETDACADLDRIIVAQRFNFGVFRSCTDPSEIHRRRVRQKYLFANNLAPMYAESLVLQVQLQIRTTP